MAEDVETGSVGAYLTPRAPEVGEMEALAHFLDSDVKDACRVPETSAGRYSPMSRIPVPGDAEIMDTPIGTVMSRLTAAVVICARCSRYVLENDLLRAVQPPSHEGGSR